MTKEASKSIRLTVTVSEPPQRGLHLAGVHETTAAQLGLPGKALRKPTYAQIINARSGKSAYAQVYVSNASPHVVAAQEYIIFNAGAQPGEEIEMRLWDPYSQAQPASSLILRSLEIGYADNEGHAKNVRQRLSDTALTVLKGHRFSIPVADREFLFEVASATPSETPVRCTEGTQVTIIYEERSTGTEQFDSTVHPGKEEAVFKDVGGLEEPIRKVMELVILPEEHPKIFQRLGIRPARGILLYGPPGSGKTLLARAIARRLGARFFTVNGPEILSKYYGESEERLRKVFMDAAEEAPSVIFIDELDSIAPSRENVSGDLEIRLVSQLLTLMDGVLDRGRVVVIGATNRLSAVDPALRRPGRFDREVEIPPPDLQGRRAILAVQTRAMPLASNVDLNDIARRTVGFVGADLASLCHEAALATVRRVLANLYSKGMDDEEWITEESIDRADFIEGLRMVQPSAFRELQQPDVQLDWDEIIGLEAAKRMLAEYIEWPIKERERLEELRLGRGDGILLMGPPLSGKTTVVTALSRRLDVSLIYVPSDELVSPWIGESEQVVRNAFTKARHASPSIVLIDNFEQLAALSTAVSAGSDLSERVLAQVHHELAELRHSALVFAVVALRDTVEPPPVKVLKNAVFSYTIKLDPPPIADIAMGVQSKLNTHSTAGEIEKIVTMVDGQPLGKVLLICDEAIRCALWEQRNPLIVEARHVELALARLGERTS